MWGLFNMLLIRMVPSNLHCTWFSFNIYHVFLQYTDLEYIYGVWQTWWALVVWLAKCCNIGLPYWWHLLRHLLQRFLIIKPEKFPMQCINHPQWSSVHSFLYWRVNLTYIHMLLQLRLGSLAKKSFYSSCQSLTQTGRPRSNTQAGRGLTRSQA